MLGQFILDPQGVESITAETIGLGLLDVVTIFAQEKITAHVEGAALGSGQLVSGYEIHAGRVTRHGAALPLIRLTMRNGQVVSELEGAQSPKGRVWGTMMHGVFDSAAWRRQFLNRVRTGKGLPSLLRTTAPNALTHRLQEYDRFADVMETHVDIARIRTLIEGNEAGKR
jgi:adenosylcobyric acid synthase